MNNKKRITSLFVCLSILITLFSGIGTAQAAKNGAVIDFEQAEPTYASNSRGFEDLIYDAGDGWTVTARKSHPGHTPEIIEGTHGKDSKVLTVKTQKAVAGSTAQDPTNQITFKPDKANTLSDTNQYLEVEFDIMLNGKSNLEVIGGASSGNEGGRGMRLLAASNGITKNAKVDMAKDSTSITLDENKWNHFRFVFQSGDITDENGATDDKHKYWVYMNGAPVTNGENKFVTDKGGYISKFFGFNKIEFRMLSDFDGTTRDTTSDCEMHIDNFSVEVCETFPDTIYTKTVDFDGIGETENTDDSIAACKANLPFWAETSGTECINELSFVGGALGKEANDISAKLYQTEEHIDVQRLVLRETGFESNLAPAVNDGEWYVAEFEMAKLGTQSEAGIHAFYNHDMGSDGKGGSVLMKIAESGLLYVNETETGIYIDEAWHKYTLAIRAGNPEGEGDETTDLIKLYIDGQQVLSEEFVTTTRVDGGEFELLPEFKGVKQLWFQNFQKDAFDADKAASSAVYFDNITVGNMGKTKKFDIEILDNEKPVIEIEGAQDGDEFSGDSLPVITAVASDDYGIKKFEYYLDGELIEAAPEGEDTIVATFENITGGEHTLDFVAEDIYGITVQETVTISFVINKKFVTYSTDFSKYAGGSHDNLSFSTNNHGSFEAVQIDEEHGKSVAIVLPDNVDESGEKENWNTAGGNTPWMGIPINNVTTPVDVEFDFNVSTRPAKYSEEYGWQTTHDDFIRFGFKTTKGEINFIRIKHDGINTYETYETPIVPYDTNKWYTAKISMHADGGTFAVVITDGDDVVLDVNGSLSYPVTQIRLFQAYHAQSAGILAIDNLSISSSFGMPEFVAPEEGISGGVNEFTVKLSESLAPEDVTADTLVVENEFGRVKVKKAVLTGNDLAVTTVSPIIGNMDYTFTLPNTTRFSTGDEVGFVIQNTLTTLPADFEILNGDLGTYSFIFDALNNTNDVKNITLIFQTWNKQGQVTKVKAITKEIAINTEPQSYTAVHDIGVTAGEMLKVYILDGLKNPKVVSPVIYTVD